MPLEIFGLGVLRLSRLHFTQGQFTANKNLGSLQVIASAIQQFLKSHFVKTWWGFFHTYFSILSNFMNFEGLSSNKNIELNLLKAYMRYQISELMINLYKS